MLNKYEVLRTLYNPFDSNPFVGRFFRVVTFQDGDTGGTKVWESLSTNPRDNRNPGLLMRILIMGDVRDVIIPLR